MYATEAVFGLLAVLVEFLVELVDFVTQSFQGRSAAVCNVSGRTISGPICMSSNLDYFLTNFGPFIIAMAIYGLILTGLPRLQSAYSTATRWLKGIVTVMHRHAEAAEHARGHAFAHAERTGEAEDDHRKVAAIV